MSPEQARGKAVDKRCDLWAFGARRCSRCSTGARAFRGEDVTDTIASVIAKEPDWSRLPADTPAAIRRLLRRCLEKDRSRRLADAGDALLEIDEALIPSPADASVATRSAAARSARIWLVAGGLGIALGAAVALLWRAPWRTAPPPQLQRLSADSGTEVRWRSASAIPSRSRRTGPLSPSSLSRESLAARSCTCGSQPAARHAVDWDRRCQQPVLFARREVDWVLRRRQAQEDRRHGWCGGHGVRRRERPRRILGRRWRDRLRSLLTEPGARRRRLVQRLVGRRRGAPDHRTGRWRRHAAVAASVAGRQSHSLDRQPQRRRLQRRLPDRPNAAGRRAQSCPAR